MGASGGVVRFGVAEALPGFPGAMVTLCIVIITGIVTLLAFNQPALRDRLMFRPRAILADKEWERLLTSALIHADWMHVIFNLVGLHSFGRVVEIHYGPWVLLFIYLMSVLGGSLVSLMLHRNHEYAALGASGGVCGVMFASIFLVPGTSVGMFLIPIPIPGKLFAMLYLVGTFIALKRGGGNIGHDAHFGGATIGMLLVLLIDPRRVSDSPWTFAGALAFSVICLVVLSQDLLRDFGGVGSWFRRSPPPPPPASRFGHLDENRARREKQEEIDRILDKISKYGMASLTAAEHRALDEHSGRRR